MAPDVITTSLQFRVAIVRIAPPGSIDRKSAVELLACAAPHGRRARYDGPGLDVMHHGRARPDDRARSDFDSRPHKDIGRDPNLRFDDNGRNHQRHRHIVVVVAC